VGLPLGGVRTFGSSDVLAPSGKRSSQKLRMPRFFLPRFAGSVPDSVSALYGPDEVKIGNMQWVGLHYKERRIKQEIQFLEGWINTLNKDAGVTFEMIKKLTGSLEEAKSHLENNSKNIQKIENYAKEKYPQYAY
jgi:hypothetical protein